MNRKKQRMENNWDRVKGQIKAMWGDLDEDALKKTRGNLTKLVNYLHDETGEDKQLIFRKIGAIL